MNINQKFAKYAIHLGIILVVLAIGMGMTPAPAQANTTQAIYSPVVLHQSSQTVAAQAVSTCTHIPDGGYTPVFVRCNDPEIKVACYVPMNTSAGPFQCFYYGGGQP